MHLPRFVMRCIELFEGLVGADLLPAVAAATAAVYALARDDGDDRRHAGGSDGNLPAGNRTGIGCVVFAAATAAGAAGIQLLDFVLTRNQAGDNQRLVELCAAACAQGEGFAAGIARAGHADGERARRAALIAARLKQNLMNDQCRAVVIVCIGAAEMRRIAQERMFPLRIRTVGVMHAIAGIAGMTARHHIAPPARSMGKQDAVLGILQRFVLRLLAAERGSAPLHVMCTAPMMCRQQRKAKTICKCTPGAL